MQDSQDDLHEADNEAKLMHSEDVKQPEVHAWQFVDLEFEATKAQEEQDQALYEKVKKDLEPKLTQQAAILKKEAFEEAKQEGFEEGYQAGFSTGQTQGLEKAQETAKETLEPQLAIFSSILDQLSQPQKQVADKVFLQVAQMAIAFAERLVGESIEANPQRIARVVSDAIALLPNPEAELVVELNPEDIKLVEYYQKETSENWSYVANNKLSRGCCKVRSLDTVVVDDWQQKLKEMLDKANLLVEDLASSEEPQDKSQDQQDQQQEGDALEESERIEDNAKP